MLPDLVVDTEYKLNETDTVKTIHNAITNLKKCYSATNGVLLPLR